MNPSSSELWMAALRRHGRMMLVVAVVALVPALAVTALLDAVGTRDGAIVNGLLAPDGPTDLWTTARITLTFQGAELNLAVPVLVVVGWLAAIAVSLELLGGATVRLAVRDAARRAVPLLGVTVLLILLGLAALYLGLATAVIVGNGVTGGAGVALGAGVAFAGLLAPARLALALPAIAVDGIEASTAMRRAWGLTRGRTLGNGASLILLGIVVPEIALAAASSIGRWSGRYAGTPSGLDAVWAGIGPVLEDLVVIAAVPLQAAVLLGAYLAARAGQAVPLPAPADGRTPRRLAVGGLVLLVAAPTVVSAAVVAANPRHLAVVSMAEPHEGFWRSPVEFVVLDDGATAMVEYGQVSVCRDVRCVDEFASRTPCRDGGAPQPVGRSARGCTNEGNTEAAELTPDGMLLALTRTSPENAARLYWCEVEPNRDGQCQWGGAGTVQTLPTPWENWSMAITSPPTGGYAVALLGPGADEFHGRVLLITCDRLDCPQPTVQSVLEIPLPEGWWGAGVVDIDIDRASGALALGYADPNEGSLWLGGCPAGCPDGPVLNSIDAWFAEPEATGSRQQASLEVVATPTGPLAVAARWPSDEPRAWHGTAIDCEDPTCADLHMSMDSWTSAWPVVDSAGTPFVVGTYGEDRPVLRNLHSGALSLLAGTGRVVAAAFGPGDRLHIVLSGSERPTLVTCAIDHCPLP